MFDGPSGRFALGGQDLHAVRTGAVAGKFPDRVRVRAELGLRVEDDGPGPVRQGLRPFGQRLDPLPSDQAGRLGQTDVLRLVVVLRGRLDRVRPFDVSVGCHSRLL